MLEAEGYAAWLHTLFPAYTAAPFAPHHRRLWEWVWGIAPRVRPEPLVVILPRGGGKSSSAEMATVAVGARGVRRYGLYISGTQEQADKHVASVAALLEADTVAAAYPALANRAVSKYGSSRGWRRNRLSTAAGYTVDAVGFDIAARGMKIEDARPDFIVIDDVDEQHDTPAATEKKIGTLTRALLPLGANHAAVLAVQNKIHDDSIFARLSDGRADFLADRTVIGPVPAVRDLQTSGEGMNAHITGGEATWAGQDLDACRDFVKTFGLTAFLAECQHETGVLREHIWLPAWWDGKNRYDADDQRVRNLTVARWLTFDTAFTDKTTADNTACVVWELQSDYRVAIREVWQRKLTFPDLVTTVRGEIARWDYDRKLHEVVIEDVGAGMSALQTLNAAGDYPAGLLQPFAPRISKEQRARQASVWAASGRVLLPHPSSSVPWLAAYERELAHFPAVEHDDATDATSMGILYIQSWLERGLEAEARRGDARQMG